MSRSYPEPLRVTGPLLSLVLRTEDLWQRYNHFHRRVRGSQSGFPLLTPIMLSAPFQGFARRSGIQVYLRLNLHHMYMEWEETQEGHRDAKKLGPENRSPRATVTGRPVGAR
jgi:hypothetical protein